VNCPKFIVITGIDGAGKDYVAQQIQKYDPNSTIIKTPTEPFIPARLNIDECALETPAAHYFFYLASVIHASCMVEKKLAHGNVYCVRYLLDTVVYHRAMGLPIALEYETPLYRIRRPDITFLLTVFDERIRQQRLHDRHCITPGDLIVNDHSLRKAILAEYARFADQLIPIDNSRRDISDVAGDMWRIISASTVGQGAAALV
jgi:thymidylate kinase